MLDLPKEFIVALGTRYQFESKIGQGRMSSVYLARDLRLGDRRVAIKVLTPETKITHSDVRFARETKILAQLEHPSIVEIYDSGLAAGLLYYVTQYVSGESLRVRLTREKQLAVADALRIARSVAEALDYAHRHAIIHRDIKPENILLSDSRAIVSDFGFAKPIGALGAIGVTTIGSSAPGTPVYMSPEHALGDRDIDGRSDIYSLATVMHEMLVGEVPFRKSDGNVDNTRKYTEAPPSMRARRPDIPPHVDRAVIKALSPRPADRFTSALEFAQALDASSAAEAPVAVAARGTTLERFPRALKVALLLIGALLLIAGVYSAIQAGQ